MLLVLMAHVQAAQLTVWVSSYEQGGCNDPFGDPDWALRVELEMIKAGGQGGNSRATNCIESSSSTVRRSGQTLAQMTDSDVQSVRIRVVGEEDDQGNPCSLTSGLNSDDCRSDNSCNMPVVPGQTGTFECGVLSGSQFSRATISWDYTTMAPTPSPSAAPSVHPSFSPSRFPSIPPTMSPSTSIPTVPPSIPPTVPPSTSVPSVSPTRSPSLPPSAPPSKQPTHSPLFPSAHPTASPSAHPTAPPSPAPTHTPSTSAPTVEEVQTVLGFGAGAAVSTGSLTVGALVPASVGPLAMAFNTECDAEAQLSVVLHPTGLRVGGSNFLGCIVGGILLCMGAAAVCGLIMVLLRGAFPENHGMFTKAEVSQTWMRYVPVLRDSDYVDVAAVASFPNLVLVVFCVIYQGVCFAAFLAVFQPDTDAFYLPPSGAFVVIATAIVPFSVWWRIRLSLYPHCVPPARVRPWDLPVPGWWTQTLLLGRTGDWVSRRREDHWVRRWQGVCRAYNAENASMWAPVELGSMWLLGLLSALNASSLSACGHVRVGMAAVHALRMGYVLYYRPYRCGRETVGSVVFSVLLITALGFAAARYYSGAKTAKEQGVLLSLASALILGFALMKAAGEAVLLFQGHRARSQRLEWGEAALSPDFGLEVSAPSLVNVSRVVYTKPSLPSPLLSSRSKTVGSGLGLLLEPESPRSCRACLSEWSDTKPKLPGSSEAQPTIERLYDVTSHAVENACLYSPPPVTLPASAGSVPFVTGRVPSPKGSPLRKLPSTRGARHNAVPRILPRKRDVMMFTPRAITSPVGPGLCPSILNPFELSPKKDRRSGTFTAL
eukprot:Hpha_TRINITY_DN10888_c0_g1::TRINITY_DN10888_c0_g1_i1::g.23061::m.23061